MSLITNTAGLVSKALPSLHSVQGGASFAEMIVKQLEELGCVVFKGSEGAKAATNFEAYLLKGNLTETPWVKVVAKHANAQPHSTVFIPITGEQTQMASDAAKGAMYGLNHYAKGAQLGGIENQIELLTKHGEIAYGNHDAAILQQQSPLFKSGLMYSWGNGTREKVVKSVYKLANDIDPRQLECALVK